MSTRPRLIPCLLLKNGLIVRSQSFKIHQLIGAPMPTVERFSQWNVDELVVLDISDYNFHDLRRDDLQIHYTGTSVIDVLKAIAKVCFMPLSFGGRIRTLEDIHERLKAGADKCIINSQIVKNPQFIEQAASKFGSQCIVASIDVKKIEPGKYEVYIHGGKTPTGLNPEKWAEEVERRGVGEIFLNSIDRDGTGKGYDIDLIRKVTSVTTIPIIACGGVGKYEHLPEGIIEGGAQAVAAANIFHFFELSYPYAKKTCIKAVSSMREVKLGSFFFPREPIYNTNEARRKVVERKKKAFLQDFPKLYNRKTNVRWCTKCVYPSTSAVPIGFDKHGVCSGCRVSAVRENMSSVEWKRRWDLLGTILESYRARDKKNYDCIIPVSGGKDSYFITHIIKNEFGLRPLLVTYNGNNYTSEGWENVHRMKEVFGVDHIFYSPSVELLIKLNRLAFYIMGDMNWHNHVGITTLPVRVAVQFQVPLLIWGEYGYLDVAGQFSMDDFPEMSYRDRYEHFARGYEWNYFIGLEGITEQDMLVYQYPCDQDIFNLNVRGIYIGNYVPWEANEHVKIVMEKYDWKHSSKPFDRTYRRFSNLDDIHENGIHDYLKYIKFGYGRCTDHVCKDIRAGLMTREEGIQKIKQYDHVKPHDLQRWLDYVGMSEEEFDLVADTFRDPRVWRFENGEWKKDNIWDLVQV